MPEPFNLGNIFSDKQFKIHLVWYLLLSVLFLLLLSAIVRLLTSQLRRKMRNTSNVTKSPKSPCVRVSTRVCTLTRLYLPPSSNFFQSW